MTDKLKTAPKGKMRGIINVLVEIPKDSRSKYELDKETGRLILDRDLFTSMVYPGDYGMVPDTLCDDGDPLDALVLVNVPHYPGVMIPSRPVALLRMTDEKGEDDKVICVPAKEVDPKFADINDLKDIAQHTLAEITHFFERMKELEPGKWVKVTGWGDAEEARKCVSKAIAFFSAGKITTR